MSTACMWQSKEVQKKRKIPHKLNESFFNKLLTINLKHLFYRKIFLQLLNSFIIMVYNI